LQHINLYSQLDKIEEPSLSAKLQLRLLGVLAVVLLLVYFFVFWQLQSLHAERDVLERLEASLVAEVDALNAEKTRQENDPGIKAALSSLGAAVNFRRRLLLSVSGVGDSSVIGFADHLDSLARQSVKGVWFTEIMLRQQGNEMALLGFAEKPELLPQYIQNLSKETVFSGQQFNTVKLHVAEKKHHLLRFEVRTKGGENDTDK